MYGESEAAGKTGLTCVVKLFCDARPDYMYLGRIRSVIPGKHDTAKHAKTSTRIASGQDGQPVPLYHYCCVR